MTARERTITREVAKLEARQHPHRRAHFVIQPLLNGYAVIADDSGRQVARRESAQSANGVAYVLNQASAHGVRALGHALSGVRQEG